MINAANLSFFLSGGSSNTSPASSRGGVISSSQVTSTIASTNNIITGIQVTNSFLVPIDNYQIQWSVGNNVLSVVGGGSVVLDSGDGVYFLPLNPGARNTGFAVTVTIADLPNADQTDVILLLANENNIFENLFTAEILEQRTEYVGLYAKNTSPDMSFFQLSFWLNPPPRLTPTSPPFLERAIALGEIGDGQTSGVLPTFSEYVEPPGFSFLEAFSQADSTPLILELGPGQTIGLVLRRRGLTNTPSDVEIPSPIHYNLKFAGS